MGTAALQVPNPVRLDLIQSCELRDKGLAAGSPYPPSDQPLCLHWRLLVDFTAKWSAMSLKLRGLFTRAHFIITPYTQFYFYQLLPNKNTISCKEDPPGGHGGATGSTTPSLALLWRGPHGSPSRLMGREAPSPQLGGFAWGRLSPRKMAGVT